MLPLRGSQWGPLPLPELLRAQLEVHGFTPGDAGSCARQIEASERPHERASLFVDLGACKLIQGDVDGAIAAWRHSLSSGEPAASSRALLNLGLLYEHLHLYELALSVLQSSGAHGVAPYGEQATMAMARCQRAQGETERAMETMARLAGSLMSEEPRSDLLCETLFGLGDIAEEVGRDDRAERAWQVAASAPASEVQQAAADRLAALQHRNQHLTDADAGPVTDLGENDALAIDRGRVQLETDAEGQDVDDETAEPASDLVDEGGAESASDTDRFLVAERLLALGQVNESIDELEALLSAADQPSRQKAAFMLGQVYESHEMPDAARAMFERVLSEDDDYWAPKAALALVSPSVELDTPAPEVLAAASVVLDTQNDEPDPEATRDGDSVSEPAMVDADLKQEPLVVLLSSFDESDDTAAGTDLDSNIGSLATDLDHHNDPVFHHDGSVVDAGEHPGNPYAALAPLDSQSDDAAPTLRNPYAELAPNYDSGEVPGEDEPGDWEALFDDWPETSGAETSGAEERPTSSPFSRYT